MFRRQKIDTDPKKIEEILTRGVEAVYPDADWLRQELKSGRRLRLYTGWDPTNRCPHWAHDVDVEIATVPKFRT
ncbi:hypothetical protein HYV72_00790 [Candidatus Uhrbacteria bacterium]|nr:hypothetical protein [Candidatus Uhrbacteria bacterium]